MTKLEKHPNCLLESAGTNYKKLNVVLQMTKNLEIMASTKWKSLERGCPKSCFQPSTDISCLIHLGLVWAPPTIKRKTQCWDAPIIVCAYHNSLERLKHGPLVKQDKRNLVRRRTRTRTRSSSNKTGVRSLVQHSTCLSELGGGTSVHLAAPPPPNTVFRSKS